MRGKVLATKKEELDQISSLSKSAMQFATFTSRFEDRLIQSLLGPSTLKPLQAIDPALHSRAKLLVLATGLLLDRTKRNAMIELVRPTGATELAQALGVQQSRADC